jgi:type II secretory pathway pseudopilin PulG
MGRLSGSGGFTYIGMLVMIAIITISTSVLGPTWKSTARIEKEKQLLWVGDQFRQAIRQYVKASNLPAGHPPTFPADLKDLLKDPRSPGTKRYLRKIYPDPMTGKDDWVLIFSDNQRIKGVHSKSDAEPLKQDNFSKADEKFKDKKKYSDWEFVYDPSTDPQAVQQQVVQQ